MNHQKLRNIIATTYAKYKDDQPVERVDELTREIEFQKQSSFWSGMIVCFILTLILNLSILFIFIEK